MDNPPQNNDDVLLEAESQENEVSIYFLQN